MKNKTMNFFIRIISHLKKNNIVIVTGEGRGETSETIFHLLKPYFSVKRFIEKMPNIFDILKNGTLIIETDLGTARIIKQATALAKFSQVPILVVSHVGEIPVNSDLFAGEEEKTIEIKKLAQLIPSYGFLILNFDDKTVRKIDDLMSLKSFTFGFQEDADFRASDVHANHGTTFKINYKGSIIPIWQEKDSKKEHVYSALAASCVGVALGLNFVEISEALKK